MPDPASPLTTAGNQGLGELLSTVTALMAAPAGWAVGLGLAASYALAWGGAPEPTWPQTIGIGMALYGLKQAVAWVARRWAS